LKDRLPGTTLVSIGHRTSLARHHRKGLAWQSGELRPQVLAPQ
jgi:ABC-type uncharacterized transport system fused permease/ATPase subunit